MPSVEPKDGNILIQIIDLIDLESIRKPTWEKAIKLTKNVYAFYAPSLALDLKSSLGCAILSSFTDHRPENYVLDKNGILWMH